MSKAINFSSEPENAGKAWLSTWFPGEVNLGCWANRAQAAEVAFTKGWISVEDRDRISNGLPPVAGWANTIKRG